MLAFVVSAPAQTAAPFLEITRPGTTNGWPRLNSSFESNSLFTLEASTNLSAWQSIATLHDALYGYPDAAVAAFPGRYYRLEVVPRGSADDWKNQILYPDELFRSASGQSIRWVKFAILLSDPVRVFYQDSTKYPFHYDFAALRLAPFQGMDRATFDAISLHRANQQVALGTVLYSPNAGYLPPGTVFNECGIQFDGLDVYTPLEISRWFELVKATIYASNGVAGYYMPSYEQSDAVRTNADAFAALGIPVASIDRWEAVNSCYSAGWALGRLKYFTGSEVTTAFGDGRLRPEDILLTDGVPADTPMVAGIISLTPATPNSHTALLAQSFGIPFVYLPDPLERARVQALIGHKIILRATMNLGAASTKVLDVEGLLDPQFEADLLALKRPEPIQFMPKQRFGSFWASTDTLVPSDIQYFGGKAANFGLLRRYVPTNCPVAIAFSFDLWDDFLDQPLSGGQTLRAEIATRLAPYTNSPPDIVSLRTHRPAKRDPPPRPASFTAAQQQAITNALMIFNPRRNIRFRSSTNIEDSEHFTGAGLYDSYSGCLMDDLDGDTAGPCQCDPTEPRERGVFRAIQKVYASFYNDNAFLERLLHRVDETKAGMGVLVHHSFPDEEELANGVATPRFTFNLTSTPNLNGDMVTQLGAESVTNPDGTSLPEIAGLSTSSSSIYLSLKQRSSLVPLGAYVTDWPADYENFVRLFTAVGIGFRQFYPTKNGFCLDFEYKKDLNLGLVLKQVREVPQPDTNNPVTPFLINEPVTYCVAQYGSTVFASHRLKSLWTLQTANMRLATTNLANGIYTQGTCEYLENGSLQTLDGPLSSWPNASNSPAGTANYWTTGSGSGQRVWRLDTTITTNVSGSQPPIFTPADFTKRVTVTYATPLPTIPGGGATPTKTTNEMVSLQLLAGDVSCAVLQERLFATNGIAIQTSYYWPKPPGGVVTIINPLLRFVETRISGLTTTPIVLTNYYSQTYGGYSHNFFEAFVFEPRLEPGLPPATLAELNAANIQMIYVWSESGCGKVFYVLGFDQTFRRL